MYELSHCESYTGANQNSISILAFRSGVLVTNERIGGHCEKWHIKGVNAVGQYILILILSLNIADVNQAREPMTP